MPSPSFALQLYVWAILDVLLIMAKGPEYPWTFDVDLFGGQKLGEEKSGRTYPVPSNFS